MAKTKADKKALIEKYKDMIGDSKAVIVVRAAALEPNEVNAFRKGIFESEGKFHVVKNNLFKIALKDHEYEVVDSLDFGEHAVLFTKEDIVTPSKELKKFIEDTSNKDDAKVTIVGGYLDGEKLSLEQVISLADMPSIEESISMIAGILEQSLASVVNVLEDAPRSYVTILDQAFTQE